MDSYDRPFKCMQLKDCGRLYHTFITQHAGFDNTSSSISLPRVQRLTNWTNALRGV